MEFVPPTSFASESCSKKMKMEVCIIVTIFLAIIPSIVADADEPALYVFGDSLVDVGNNNYLSELAPKVNFPHYGIDYPGGVPTGRCSNGYNFADYIGKAMGKSESPAPFLSISGDIEMLKGVNFASGGSGILSTTGPGTISMDKQILDFEVVSRNLMGRLGKTMAEVFLSKSIFFLSSGGNDIVTHFKHFGLQTDSQKDQFVVLLTNKLKQQVAVLHELGARKFAFFSTTTIGCFPAIRLTNPSGHCFEELNDYSLRYKNATRAMLQELSSSLTGMHYSFADAYEIFSAIVADPLRFGFREPVVACCGLGKFNAEGGCTPNATYCLNRRDHVFWDWYHPTQAMYQLLAEFSLFGTPNIVSPINFNQLMTSKKSLKGPVSAVPTSLQHGSYDVI